MLTTEQDSDAVGVALLLIPYPDSDAVANHPLATADLLPKLKLGMA